MPRARSSLSGINYRNLLKFLYLFMNNPQNGTLLLRVIAN
jgi:hypothetical protein